jgi:CubicO group peptidase (beta-lactamase class C family)
MKYWLLLLLPAFAFGQGKKEQLEKLMAQSKIPGLSLVYVKDGKIAESYFLGKRSNDNNLPVDSSTVFAAASLSKCVFAYGLLKLVDEGKISLDSPLTRYVDYPDVKVDSRYRLVTVREALSHTSGLPNWRSGGSLKFQYDPGTRFRYSGEGFVWLSKAVDTISGSPIEKWMQDHVLKVLAMNRSSYLWQEKFADDFAQPHNDYGQTRSKYFPNEANVAHSFQTTGPDYGRFLVTILNKKGLSAKTFADAYKAQPHSSFQDYPGKLAWGLGLGYGQSDYGNYFWQWGDNGTYKAFLIGFPDKKEGLVYFTNSSNGLSVAKEVLNLFFNWSGMALNWLNYSKFQDPGFEFNQRLSQMSAQEAIKPYMLTDGSRIDTTRIDADICADMVGNLVSQKRWEEAKWLAEAAVKAYPKSTRALGALAEASLRSGDRETAANACMAYAAIDTLDETPKKALDRLLDRPDTASGKPHVFKLSDYDNARNVQLVGDFNDWNDFTLPMRWVDGAWTIKVNLKPGKHEYKFVVDGMWLPDFSNKQMNAEKNFNSVIEIK